MMAKTFYYFSCLACKGVREHGAFIYTATLCLADNVDVVQYLGIFLLSILISRFVVKLKNHMGAHRQPLAVERRPKRGAKIFAIDIIAEFCFIN